MRIRCGVLVTVLIGCGHCLSADVLYGVTDLGTLGGNGQAIAINNAGQVTGYSGFNDGMVGFGPVHAFVYSSGQIRDLGTLGGSTSQGSGINDAGQVTGWSSTSTGDHAFVYSDDRMIDLGTLGACCSYGYGINNARQV